MNELEEGVTHLGMLVDGLDGTPWLAAVLSYSLDSGVSIELPYIDHPDISQFEHVRQWAKAQATPSNMILQARDTDLSLFGCRWGGHTQQLMRGLAFMRLTVQEVVLAEQQGDLSEPLMVDRARSHMDGLAESTGLTAISSKHGYDEETGLIRSLHVDVESGEGLRWTQGDAEMTIDMTWQGHHSHPGLEVMESAVLTSRFPEPRPFEDHVAEHRKVSNLLAFLFGCPIGLRRHQVSDQRFARSMGDTKTYNPWVELISRATQPDRKMPPPTPQQLQQPLAHLAQIGAVGLSRWADRWEEWERVILPTSARLRRTGSTVEDIVLSSSLSLEAAGHLVGKVDGEEDTYTRRKIPSTSTYVLRVLADVGLDWSETAASLVGLARGVANNYNDIKHYDRGRFPDGVHSYLISRVSQVLVRLFLLKRIDESGALVEAYGKSYPFTQLKEAFAAQGKFLDVDGHFGPWPR